MQRPPGSSYASSLIARSGETIAAIAGSLAGLRLWPGFALPLLAAIHFGNGRSLRLGRLRHLRIDVRRPLGHVRIDVRRADHARLGLAGRRRLGLCLGRKILRRGVLRLPLRIRPLLIRDVLCPAKSRKYQESGGKDECGPGGAMVVQSSHAIIPIDNETADAAPRSGAEHSDAMVLREKMVFPPRTARMRIWRAV